MDEGTSARPPKNPRRARLANRDLNSQEADAELLELDDDDDDGADGGYDGVPEVGMVFKTHQEVSKFYKRYARRVGFGVSVRRSSFTKEGHCLYLELMCCKGGRKRPEPKFRKRTSATTNCQARVRVKLWGDGLLHLELASLDHNHPVSPSMARFLNCYKHLTGFAKKKALREQEENMVAQSEEPVQSVHVDKLAALEELLFRENECRSFVERGRLRFGEGDSEAIRLFFTRMQAKNSNFFNVVDLDEEGCARNVFWADARSRAAYQYYSDVVTLDTTCISNRFDLPLACFVGVNHHGQPVLLGCGLLSDETAETYIWLLKAWIACMSGYMPNAVISDYCKGIQSAVAEVLPGVRHRFCLFQIMKKVPENLGGLAEYRAIHKQLQKAVYDSLRMDEFEEEWRKMVEMYGLQGNDWLSLLYEFRHSWVPAYLKDSFWAGMSTIQRNESPTPFFEGYVDQKTSLKQFISKYEMALQSKYEKEAQADFETFHKRRPAVSKFYMEEQLSKVYTINMFKKFQDEIEAIMYCHASVVSVDGSSSTFDVKECIFLEDGKRTMNKNHGVLYDAEKKDVRCICGSFEFRGILCRHALSVFKLQQVHEIPSQFVLDRWKKDFKRLHVMNRPSEDIIANNRVDRYDYLSMRCLQLVEVGVLSDKYQLALKLIREAEKFLLSDTTYDDTRPKIISRINKANKPDKDGVQGVGKIVDVENGDEGRRRRGRPPQGKESQDGTSPNALPIGSQYGVQMNPQQYIGNQAAMRPSVVYMFPGGYDPQTLGNGSMMPWIYPQMYQAGQQPKDPTVTTGQPGRKRKVTRRRKIGQSVESFSEPSLPPAGVMPSGPAQSGPTPTGPAQPGPTSTGPAQPGPMATGSESLATAAPGPTPSPRAVPPGPVPQTAG
ncbi:protein FAR1-RELATED SEQUENCE 6-like isoform X2 [Asparagus officinalis]|uniref:protein FAR1-RELATED SEQUENCE 6-like isoform X2 n=1 Tax=Asparagus officinalis TaxID=4686 RepID=UPI00098E53B1|nr:protein FAR1-RELATED SEQUENCE 6-like isoform X2 [Asparagus officinalis]